MVVDRQQVGRSGGPVTWCAQGVSSERYLPRLWNGVPSPSSGHYRTCGVVVVPTTGSRGDTHKGSPMGQKMVTMVVTHHTKKVCGV